MHSIISHMVKSIQSPSTVENVVQELRRGALILAALSQLDDEKYGYALINQLEERGLEIDQGTLYPLLRRLEAQGLLDSKWNVEGARPRRYYVINKTGKARVKESHSGMAFSGKEHGKIACRCKVRRQTWNSSNDIYRKSAGTCLPTKERTSSRNYARPLTTRLKRTQAASRVKKRHSDHQGNGRAQKSSRLILSRRTILIGPELFPFFQFILESF